MTVFTFIPCEDCHTWYWLYFGHQAICPTLLFLFSFKITISKTQIQENIFMVYGNENWTSIYFVPTRNNEFCHNPSLFCPVHSQKDGTVTHAKIFLKYCLFTCLCGAIVAWRSAVADAAYSPCFSHLNFNGKMLCYFLQAAWLMWCIIYFLSWVPQ